MGVLGDVRYALRSLAKNPGFAAVALLTIALGVGANTAVFSVVDAVLLRPLPYPQSDRLIAIHETNRQSPSSWQDISYPNFRDWQRGMHTVEAMAAYAAYRFTVEVGDVPLSVEAARVSWNYFDVLGIAPIRGRGFMADDEAPGATAVALVSDSLWEQLFHRDPSALGRVIRLNGTPATIVGIVPPGFAGPPDMTGLQDLAEIWTPIGFLNEAGLKNREGPWISPVFARLRPGVTREQAQSELDGVTSELERLYPVENRNRGAVMVSLADQFYAGIRPMLLMLFGAVTFVLSIACVNLASLLLARGGTRARELAIRAAIGGERRRIVRLLLVESVTLSLLGGGLGLLLAVWMVDALLALSPVALPSFVRIGFDGRALSFTFAMCVASGLLFGIAPALAGTRMELLGTLKGATAATNAGSPLLRRRLVTAEISLALVLLIGAGLMIRTLLSLGSIDPGFRLDGLLRVSLWMPPDRLASQRGPEGELDAAQTLLDQVKVLPTVDDVALSWFGMPLSNGWLQYRMRVVGRDTELIRVRRHMVSPGYFRTMGIPILDGREFSVDDARAIDRPVAIISQRMARQYWPDGGPFRTTGNSATAVASASPRAAALLQYNETVYEIVGVAGDVRFTSLLEPAAGDHDVYVPFSPMTNRTFGVIVRATGDSEPIAAAIRRIVGDVSPGSVVTRVETGSTLFDQQVARQRFARALLSAFALLALVLTLVGVYGVTAYNVSRQTRDIGIRMALGATRRDVVAAVLKGELGFVFHGLVIGIVAGLALTGVLSGLIYGVSRTDPATFVSVATLVAVVAILACLIPARWATRIDPVVALRVE